MWGRVLNTLALAAIGLGMLAPVGPGGTAPARADDAAQTRDGLMIWSGFEHDWQTNHRYNRLGSRIADQACSAEDRTCRATVTSTAASGTAPDRGEATTGGWQVWADDVAFAQVTTSLRLRGREGVLIEVADELTLDLTDPDLANLADRGTYVGLVNGFDLLSGGDADKPGTIALEVGTPRQVGGSGTLLVPVEAGLLMDCSTPECQGGDTVDYELTLDVAIVAGDDEIAVAGDTVERDFTWDDQPAQWGALCGVIGDPDLWSGPTTPGPELDLDPVRKTLHGTAPADAAFVGVRRASMSVAESRHMVAHHSRVEPVSYDGTDLVVDVDMVFKNWAEGMQFAQPPLSTCSFGQAGSASAAVDLALVQLTGSAGATYVEHACTISWPGFNRSAGDDTATCETATTFALGDGIEAELGAEPASGPAPLVTSLAATPVSGAVYDWDVDGDGAVDVSTAEPAFTATFDEPGSFTPTVTVRSEAGVGVDSTDVVVHGSTFQVATSGIALDGAAARGSVSMTRDPAGLPSRLQGSIELADPVPATVYVNVQRLWFLPLYLGLITVDSGSQRMWVPVATDAVDADAKGASFGGTGNAFILSRTSWLPRLQVASATWAFTVVEA